MQELPIDALGSLALFARVVELRSFSAAARASGIAKSVVSRRVGQLEERFGVQLLRRTTRKLSLTGDGLRLYEHASRLVAAAAEAEASMASAASPEQGSVRIGAPVTFAQMHLGRAVAGFLALHPRLQVQLDAEDRIQDVVEGGHDVVVRITAVRDSTLVARRLATDRLVVCAAPAYLQRAGVPESPDDLVRHNCLHYALVPLAAEWTFRGATGPYRVPVRGNFASTDGTVLREAALAGLGLAVAPSFMVARELAAGRLVEVLAGARRAELGVYAVVARRRNLPARVRLLLDFLSARFAAMRWGAETG
jgi:DNA-binding transcriptional LysR family regulator